MFSKFSEDSVYRAAGWSWDSAFGKGRLMNEAFRHPFGITVLVTSVLLALAMALAPAMETWAGWAPWVVLWGLVCYGASVIAVTRTRPTPNEPELRELESVRRMINAKLKERRSSEGWARSGVTRILEEAHEYLERRIMPAMAELLELQKSLTQMLDEFESGNLPAPDPDRLDRLHRLHSRRKAIIEESVVRSANAAATLIELLQEHDEATVEIEGEARAKEVLDIYEAIISVMRRGAAVDTDDDEGPEPEIDPEPQATTDVTEDPERGPAVYSALELCLRRLNKPGDLARCQLLELLPNLVEQRCARMNGGDPGPRSPLDKAGALRDLIVEEIELLKPAGMINRSDPAASRYIVLHEQYVKRRTVKQIAMMVNAAEAGVYRYRREAIASITLDLIEKEEMAS